jgi:hypothetical protein
MIENSHHSSPGKIYFPRRLKYARGDGLRCNPAVPREYAIGGGYVAIARLAPAKTAKNYATAHDCVLTPPAPILIG